MISRTRIVIPRETLLVEIERRCGVGECTAKTRIGLTRDEAQAYLGFECDLCKAWNTDALTERDVPEWSDELSITDVSLTPSDPHGNGTSTEGVVE